MSLMNLNCSLVHFKALDKKINIVSCLCDCLAPRSGWLVFFFKEQLRFISYFNVYCRLLNNWFSGSRTCTKSDRSIYAAKISVKVFSAIVRRGVCKEEKNLPTILRYIVIDLSCSLEGFIAF